MQQRQLFSLLNFAIIVFVIGSYVIVAQDALTGTWTANAKAEKQDKLQVTFERSSENGKNRHGSSFAYADLGLTPDQTQNGRVTFRLAREAGTIECEGSFTDGKGSGTFRFAPNYAYADSMKARGFDFAKNSKHGTTTVEDRLFVAVTLNVTTALADQLLSANFGNLDVDDLFKAAIFKITPEFMAEMKATGFPDLSMEDLVKARIFKIDAEYVRQMQGHGFAVGDFEGLVKFRIFKVTPEFLNSLRAEGLTDLSREEIVKLKIFNIDAQFIREARAEEPNITVERMVQKRIGVRGR